MDNVTAENNKLLYRGINHWQINSSPKKIREYYRLKYFNKRIENKNQYPFLIYPEPLWDTENLSLGIRQKLIFPSDSAWISGIERHVKQSRQINYDRTKKFVKIGGSVKLLSWCPNVSSDRQILAVLVSDNSAKHKLDLSPSSNKDVIQIWDIGKTTNMVVQPRLLYNFEHKWGSITQMKWISPDEPNIDVAKQTEYLRDAGQVTPLFGHILFCCTDGYMRVCAIPKFNDSTTDLRTYQFNPENILLLALHHDFHKDSREFFGYPTCVSYLSSFPGWMVAGYSTGNIGIFDLTCVDIFNYDCVHHYLVPVHKRLLSLYPIKSIAMFPSNWQTFNYTVDCPDPKKCNFVYTFTTSMVPMVVIHSTNQLNTCIWPSRSDLLVSVPITNESVTATSIVSGREVTIPIDGIRDIVSLDSDNSILVSTEVGSLLSVSLSELSIIRQLMTSEDQDFDEPKNIRDYRLLKTTDSKGKITETLVDCTSRQEVVSLYDTDASIHYPIISAIDVNPNIGASSWVAVGFEFGIIHIFKVFEDNIVDKELIVQSTPTLNTLEIDCKPSTSVHKKKDKDLNTKTKKIKVEDDNQRSSDKRKKSSVKPTKVKSSKQRKTSMDLEDSRSDTTEPAVCSGEDWSVLVEENHEVNTINDDSKVAVALSDVVTEFNESKPESLSDNIFDRMHKEVPTHESRSLDIESDHTLMDRQGMERVGKSSIIEVHEEIKVLEDTSERINKEVADDNPELFKSTEMANAKEELESVREEIVEDNIILHNAAVNSENIEKDNLIVAEGLVIEYDKFNENFRSGVNEPPPTIERAVTETETTDIESRRNDSVMEICGAQPVQRKETESKESTIIQSTIESHERPVENKIYSEDDSMLGFIDGEIVIMDKSDVLDTYKSSHIIESDESIDKNNILPTVEGIELGSSGILEFVESVTSLKDDSQIPEKLVYIDKSSNNEAEGDILVGNERACEDKLFVHKEIIEQSKDIKGSELQNVINGEIENKVVVTFSDGSIVDDHSPVDEPSFLDKDPDMVEEVVAIAKSLNTENEHVEHVIHTKGSLVDYDSSNDEGSLSENATEAQMSDNDETDKLSTTEDGGEELQNNKTSQEIVKLDIIESEKPLVIENEEEFKLREETNDSCDEDMPLLERMDDGSNVEESSVVSDTVIKEIGNIHDVPLNSTEITGISRNTDIVTEIGDFTLVTGISDSLGPSIPCEESGNIYDDMGHNEDTGVVPSNTEITNDSKIEDVKEYMQNDRNDMDMFVANPTKENNDIDECLQEIEEDLVKDDKTENARIAVDVIEGKEFASPSDVENTSTEEGHEGCDIKKINCEENFENQSIVQNAEGCLGQENETKGEETNLNIIVDKLREIDEGKVETKLFPESYDEHENVDHMVESTKIDDSYVEENENKSQFESKESFIIEETDMNNEQQLISNILEPTLSNNSRFEGIDDHETLKIPKNSTLGSIYIEEVKVLSDKNVEKNKEFVSNPTIDNSLVTNRRNSLRRPIPEEPPMPFGQNIDQSQNSKINAQVDIVVSGRRRTIRHHTAVKTTMKNDAVKVSDEKYLDGQKNTLEVDDNIIDSGTLASKPIPDIEDTVAVIEKKPGRGRKKFLSANKVQDDNTKIIRSASKSDSQIPEDETTNKREDKISKTDLANPSRTLRSTCKQPDGTKTLANEMEEILDTEMQTQIILQTVESNEFDIINEERIVDDVVGEATKTHAILEAANVIMGRGKRKSKSAAVFEINKSKRHSRIYNSPPEKLEITTNAIGMNSPTKVENQKIEHHKYNEDSVVEKKNVGSLGDAYPVMYLGNTRRASRSGFGRDSNVIKQTEEKQLGDPNEVPTTVETSQIEKTIVSGVRRKSLSAAMAQINKAKNLRKISKSTSKTSLGDDLPIETKMTEMEMTNEDVVGNQSLRDKRQPIAIINDVTPKRSVRTSECSLKVDVTSKSEGKGVVVEEMLGRGRRKKISSAAAAIDKVGTENAKEDIDVVHVRRTTLRGSISPPVSADLCKQSPKGLNKPSSSKIDSREIEIQETLRDQFLRGSPELRLVIRGIESEQEIVEKDQSRRKSIRESNKVSELKRTATQSRDESVEAKKLKLGDNSPITEGDGSDSKEISLPLKKRGRTSAAASVDHSQPSIDEPLSKKRRTQILKSRKSDSGVPDPWWHSKDIEIAWRVGRHDGVRQTLSGDLFDEEPIVGMMTKAWWGKKTCMRQYPVEVLQIL